MKKIIVAVALLIFALAGCSSDADVVSKNISTAADQFEINRRIVFYNGITDKYMLTIEGKCNIDPHDRQLDVTCKLGDNNFKKHFLGLSDNVTYVVEQIDGAPSDPNHYRVIFKPESLIPNVDHP